ncbi:hypothetical protein PLICRDRAFT_241821 [Plicaturopsis crispa FD-325 SS-3]|nr:hypothetical protein PLICRDRAFT_241821 [Plicaturopsis crispa FD-325 SS-3]
MSISRRISIAWSGGPPAEDTDTVVLTGHTYFVDVRIKTDTSPPSLDWAFAGQRSSEPGLQEGELMCTWLHAVDSRSTQPVEDSGIVTVDTDDPLKSVERGIMLNPASGLIESHQETWHDDALPVGTLVAFFERADGQAFVGVVGATKQGVGWDFAWRVVDDTVVYQTGPVDGLDVVVSGDEQVGESVGEWIVREIWRTQ